MKKLFQNQAGSHVVLVAVALIAVALIGFAGYRVASDGKQKEATTNDSAITQQPTEPQEPAPDIIWQSREDGGWVASATPPACAEPFSMQLPVPIGDVKSVLYPGQKRSTGYKPHGGLTMKSTSNSAELRAPFDARVTSGSRYLEDGEVQYLLFFVHPCGMAYRFDHLLTLSPDMQTLIDTLPAPQVDDSRTHTFNVSKKVKKGDVIATAVGHTTNKNNIGFDLGVYDLRKPNEASKSPTYQAAHKTEGSQAFHALCWLDLMPEKAQLRALPSTDSKMGKTSDYCK